MTRTTTCRLEQLYALNLFRSGRVSPSPALASRLNAWGKGRMPGLHAVGGTWADAWARARRQGLCRQPRSEGGARPLLPQAGYCGVACPRTARRDHVWLGWSAGACPGGRLLAGSGRTSYGQAAGRGLGRGSWTDRMAAKRTPAEFGVPCAMSEYVSGRLGKRRKRVRAAPAGHHGMQFPVTGPGTTSACRGARRSISPVSRPCRMTAACVRRTSGQTTLSRRCPPRWAIRNPQHPVIV